MTPEQYFNKLQERLAIFETEMEIMDDYIHNFQSKKTNKDERLSFAKKYGYESYAELADKCQNWVVNAKTLENRYETLEFLRNIDIQKMMEIQKKYALCEPIENFLPSKTGKLINILRATILDRKMVRMRNKNRPEQQKEVRVKKVIQKPIVKNMPMFFEDEENIPESPVGVINMSSGVYGSHRTTNGSSEEIV